MRYLGLLAVLLTASHPLSAQIISGAGSGVTEINQKTLNDGNPAIGDTTPGAPITITVPGSYRFSSNIASGNVAVPGIEINIANFAGLTLDLNGFALSGASNLNGCVSSGNPVSTRTCPAPTAADGISVSGSNVTIRNGRVSNFAGHGIDCANCTLSHLTTHSNLGYGIFASFLSQVSDSVSRDNGFGGISNGSGRVENSTASANSRYGIVAAHATDSTVNLTFRTASENAVGVFTQQGQNLTVTTTFGTGIQTTGTISESHVSAAETGVVLLPGASITGSAVQASIQGINAQATSVALDNIVNAPTPISGNVISGRNVCNSTVC